MGRKERGVTLVPIASALHDPRSTERVLSCYRKWLAGTYEDATRLMTSPDDLVGPGVRGSAGILGLVLTGGTERVIGAVAALGMPFLVLAHESMNSLPAALEAMSTIPHGATRLVLGRGVKQLAEVRAFARAAETLARVGRHSIGLVGGPSPWLTYSLPDIGPLFSRLGIRVVELPAEEFRRAYNSAPPLASQVLLRGGGSTSIPASDLSKSQRVYEALRSICEEHRLSAVSPRCFDFIKDFGATACLALSRLNDEGVVAGCEGDIPSTVGMITLAEVSGRPTFMGNPSFIRGHRLVLAHCTVATKLTEATRYRTHFESGMGVALAGEFKRGARVTVARFAKGYASLRAGLGRIARGAPWSEDLCRTQAEIRMDGSADVFWQRPMGNHLVMTLGDHVDALRHLTSIAGIEFEEV